MTIESEAGDRETNPYAAAIAGRRWTLEELTALLEPWFAERIGVPKVELRDARYPSGAGTSSATVLVTATWEASGETQARHVVFRSYPDQFQLFLDPDFGAQYRILEVLHRDGRVPVPEPLWFEADPSVVGLPFFVMEQADGKVPVTSPPYNREGFLADATPQQRETAWTTAMEALCAIACTPLDELGWLDQPELGPTGLEQQLEYWRRCLMWVTGDDPPSTFGRILDWLGENLPADRQDGLAWGDARIGNMIFGDDFRLRAVVDWEQVNLGGIRQDLGWWLFFDHFHAGLMGLERLPGLGTREQTIRMWEERTGQEAGDLTWYEVFTGFKVGILTVRTLTLMGAPNARDVEALPALGYTCELAGLRLED